MILRIVLRQRNPLREWQDIEVGVTNELTFIECSRVLDRLRLAGARPIEVATRHRKVADILSRLDVIRFDRALINRASEPLPVTLGTLDAIHLASARLFRDQQSRDERPLEFATHDLELATAARAIHFPVLGA